MRSGTGSRSTEISTGLASVSTGWSGARCGNCRHRGFPGRAWHGPDGHQPPQQYEQVVSRVLPSVVEISTSQGSGSGVVYDGKGDIVTNAHVVGTAATVRVSPASGGKALAATVLGVFAPDDLAVIKVDSGAGALHPASFGRSASVQAGEIVLAMGNPLGLTGTVTDGIVSATGRTVSEGQGSSAVLISAIQTSAAIDHIGSIFFVFGALVLLPGIRMFRQGEVTGNRPTRIPCGLHALRWYWVPRLGRGPRPRTSPRWVMPSGAADNGLNGPMSWPALRSAVPAR